MYNGLNTNTSIYLKYPLIPFIQAAFEDVGVDLKRPIITSCGSSVSATMLALSLNQLGIKVAVYDVSLSLLMERRRKKCRRRGEKGE